MLNLIQKRIGKYLRAKLFQLINTVSVDLKDEIYNPEEIYRDFKKIKSGYSKEITQRIFSDLQSCGANVQIGDEVHISIPKSVIIGNNVQIGRSVTCLSAGGVTIGDNTIIADNVSIYTQYWDPCGRELPSEPDGLAPVCIGKNVIIGQNAIILAGVNVGDGAVIGAGAVVLQDIPQMAIVQAALVQIEDFRDKKQYSQLEKNQKHAGISHSSMAHSSINQFSRTGDQLGDQVFFVVSTGRSGSMSIANILSQHPEITCLHQPRHQLIRLSSEFSHNLRTQMQTYSELYSIYRNSSVYPTGLYGESDHKLFNLIPMLADILPRGKFIWLIRDGRDVVASTYSRGFYNPEILNKARPASNPWPYFRLNGGRTGAYTIEEWEQLSDFTKNCWRWSYMNDLIEKQLHSLPESRWVMIKLEELDRRIGVLFNHLQVNSFEVEILQDNKAHYHIKKYQEWDVDKKASFNQLCGSNMHKWYPRWE